MLTVSKSEYTILIPMTFVLTKLFPNKVFFKWGIIPRRYKKPKTKKKQNKYDDNQEKNLKSKQKKDITHKNHVDNNYY